MSSDNAILIFARLNSSRYPKKVLANLGGLSLLEVIYAQIKGCGLYVYLCVPHNERDFFCKWIELKGLTKRIGLLSGSSEDLVDRVLINKNFLNQYKWLIRINGDNPFIDSKLIKEFITYLSSLAEMNIDYVSSTYDEQLPIGFHFEAFTLNALLKANEGFLSAEEREHLTPAFYRYPESYSAVCFLASARCAEFKTLYMTVDYAFDLISHRKVVDRLGLSGYVRANLNDLREFWPWFCFGRSKKKRQLK